MSPLLVYAQHKIHLQQIHIFKQYYTSHAVMITSALIPDNVSSNMYNIHYTV